ncbi:MAG: tRNA (adenosine(37)-N6)-dimethylallyltransferase MiaA [Holophagaceae bacterium]
MKLAVVGPTASGKTQLATALAKLLGATIINGDPFQSLQGCSIGTGQPTSEELDGQLNQGYGCFPLSIHLNPKDFGLAVNAWMKDLSSTICVTGSGLYLRGIWNQFSPLPEVPVSVINRLRERTDRESASVLYQELATIDPDRAREIHPNDRARIERALALYEVSGVLPSQLMAGVSLEVPSDWKVIVLDPPRDLIRESIQRRVHRQISSGWPAEIASLRAQGHEADLRRLRPLGYETLMDEVNLAVAQDLITVETQQYAKRQSTWFRHQIKNVLRLETIPSNPMHLMSALGVS